MALGSTAGYDTLINITLRTNYPPAECLPTWLSPMYPSRTGPMLEWLVSKWLSGSTPGELSVDMSYNAPAFGASAFVAGSGGTQAHQSLTLTAGSGAVGATINGTLVTVTWAVSDAVTVGLLAQAILANAVIGGLINAQVTTPAGQASPGVLQLTANVGPYGQTLANAITTVASGTGMVAGGATFAGGVNATLVQATSNG